MDFTFTEVQEDLRGLARKILQERATTERLKELEAGTERVDRDLWAELATTNLLGIALPEDVGGSGYGLMELGIVLNEVGRQVAPVPMVAMAIAAVPIATFGSPEQRSRLLAPVVAGERFITAALEEPAGANPLQPSTTATRDGDGWLLTGNKIAVPWGQLADDIVVSADNGLFVVTPDQPGVTVEPATGTTTEPQARLLLDSVRVEDDNAIFHPSAMRFAYLHGVAATCATAVGVFEKAIEITATYITERHQFDRPIATFQGATLKIADAYIDLQAITVATWSALWQFAENKPGYPEALATAKFWVADGGQRVAYACQHLHGGIGVDRDYPLHRYFLWAKELEVMFGGTTSQLLRVAV
ncbi:MAG TPA: acyl-CoA dehydrogenase family protein [Acidimicrobiales bacterium]|nr:acyl-CoA dehydrogenase family protein [Acidimicrobiales bacterium]